MAKVLGEAGRFVSQSADKKAFRMLIIALLCGGACCWVSGFLFGFWFYKKTWWVSLLVDACALAAVLIVPKWAYRQMEILEKKRNELRKGARGEVAVGLILADFPDTFCVINDLTTKFGNVDHVVVGPTGIFALDTKTWRGIISSDGKGELLLNDRQSEDGKPHVKTFTR